MPILTEVSAPLPLNTLLAAGATTRETETQSPWLLGLAAVTWRGRFPNQGNSFPRGCDSYILSGLLTLLSAVPELSCP